MEDEGEDLKEHLTAKYGPRATASFDDPNSHLKRMGRLAGIEFTNDRKIYPTLKAHALLEYAKEQDNEQANRLMEVIFHRYFEKGENINDVEVLKNIAGEVGMEADKAEEAINDWRNIEGVKAKDENVKTRMGVSGVPFFIVKGANSGRPTGFSGAQPSELIAELLQEMSDE